MSTTQGTPALRLPVCPVPASWLPIASDDSPSSSPSCWRSACCGPVSSTWTTGEGFRLTLEDGPEGLTLAEAEQLLAQLTAALFLARAAGDRIAENLTAEHNSRRARIAAADDTAPAHDADEGPLSFGLPDFGPLATSWTLRTGFRYSIRNCLHLDDAGARRVRDALEQVLRDCRAARRRMDEHAARWADGEDLEGSGR